MTEELALLVTHAHSTPLLPTLHPFIMLFDRALLTTVLLCMHASTTVRLLTQDAAQCVLQWHTRVASTKPTNQIPEHQACIRDQVSIHSLRQGLPKILQQHARHIGFGCPGGICM
jgi:hypothetical protein